MKTVTFVENENYQIIIDVENTSPDPEETNSKVDSIIEKNPNILLQKTRKDLLEENVVFVRPGQGQKNVGDDEGNKLKSLLDGLGPNERLQLSGDTVADFRNTEYWIKRSGIWSKQKIKYIAEMFPSDAVLPEKLSQIQQREISEQNEAQRIAELTLEQKNDEKEAALTAAKREVRYLKEEAEITGEPFDAAMEFQLKKAEIEKKFG